MGIIIAYFSDGPVLNTNKVQDMFLKPKFYGRLEGPVFTALDYNRVYAIRHYETSLWVSTIVTGDFENAWKEGVPKLRKYITGANQKKWLLPKTCPILMKKICHANKSMNINVASAFTETQKITVSMYISKYFFHEVPGPTDPDVFLQEEYKRIYFTGYVSQQFNQTNATKEKEEMEAAMLDNDEQFDDGGYFVAFYNMNARMKKQNYYEYWFYGKKLEESYKCLTNYIESGDEEQNETTKRRNDDNLI